MARLAACLLFAFSLTGCGIPNYFYLGSNYVAVNASSQPPSSAVVSFQVTDKRQLDKCLHCPSICLFYVIDNGGSVYQSNKSKIKSSFASKFGTVSNKGALLSVSSSQPVSVIDAFTPDDDQSVKVTLFPLSFANGADIARPSYHVQVPVYDNGRPQTDTIRFKLEFDPDEKRLWLLFPLVADADEEDWFRTELARAGKGKTFAELSEITDLAECKRNNSDMGAVTDPSLMKLNIMAALCASQGDYDNIYWSQLSDLNDVAAFDL